MASSIPIQSFQWTLLLLHPGYPHDAKRRLKFQRKMLLKAEEFGFVPLVVRMKIDFARASLGLYAKIRGAIKGIAQDIASVEEIPGKTRKEYLARHNRRDHDITLHITRDGDDPPSRSSDPSQKHGCRQAKGVHL